MATCEVVTLACKFNSSVREPQHVNLVCREPILVYKKGELATYEVVTLHVNLVGELDNLLWNKLSNFSCRLVTILGENPSSNT